MAAEKPAGLEFSGSALDSLRPAQTRQQSTRFEFLQEGNSVSGVVQAPQPSAAPAVSRRSNSLQDLGAADNWLDIERQDGRPTASAFERAAGVRNPGGRSSEGAGGFGAESMQDNQPPKTSPPSISRSSLSSGSTLELSGGLGDRFSLTGRSLDPVISSVDSASSVPGLRNNGGADLPALKGIPNVVNPARSGNSFSDLRPDQLKILGISQFSSSENPRSIRDLMGGSPRQSTRFDSDLRMLDQDATREELNPYLPQRRGDYQNSRAGLFGNARTGSDGRSNSSSLRDSDPNSLRSLSSGGLLGASSLAPAVALPMNEAPRPGRAMGQSSQYQFPGRKF